MSYITEVVVWAEAARAEVVEALTAPLPFDEERHQRLGALDMDAAGGSKWFTSGVYAAALNHVSSDALEKWFESLPWGTFDRAYMLWCAEGEYSGRVDVNWSIEPDGGW